MVMVSDPSIPPDALPYIVGPEAYDGALRHCLECLQNKRINKSVGVVCLVIGVSVLVWMVCVVSVPVLWVCLCCGCACVVGVPGDRCAW